jgi:thioredoxin-related protein
LEDWPSPVLVDDGSGTAGARFGLRSFPTMIFVDASGQVVGRLTGTVPIEQFEAAVEFLSAG